MESVSAQMVDAAKLPVLNLGEFELWKMRIEQYFLMTNYALWEVIVNGDSPPLMRTVDGVEQTYPPTTAEEKLSRKNELKARGTLLMVLLNERQLKFNSYKNAKSMIEAIKKRCGDLETLSMDDLYNNMKIYETKVKESSSSSQNSQNVAFMSSNSSGGTNQAYGSNSGNTDSLSDDVIYYFFMAMLTMRARRFLKNTGRKVAANGSETTRMDLGMTRVTRLKMDLQTLHLWPIHLQVLQVLQAQILRPKAVLNDVQGNQVNAVKASEKGFIDSGCSRHMTENMSNLS
nr:hypothetical protein [Tanacetum cinerariifolium]